MGIIGMFVVVFSALAVVAALADQTNGNGKTFLGNSFGFNAKDDLTGESNYHFTDVNNNAVDMHCSGYSLYISSTTPNGLYPRSIVKSETCVNKDTDEALTMRAEFVDRGEPGADRDKVCIRVNDSNGMLLILDCGRIQKGNVQIHGPETTFGNAPTLTQ